MPSENKELAELEKKLLQLRVDEEKLRCELAKNSYEQSEVRLKMLTIKG